MPSDQPRYAITELNRYATDLFAAAGVPPERAAILAQFLVEADAMGHDTHGLNLCALYLDHLQSGEMAVRGEFTVIADRSAAVVWDGSYLSGVWLNHQAIQLGCQRAKAFGTATISIRRSHHIACLAAFLPLATDRGLMITLASSDPSVAAVAPFGFYEAKFIPNLLAVGIPTATDPIPIDISASATTMGLTARMEGRGEKLAGDWLVDNQGRASNDPAVLEADPPGALLALGGLDRGHKCFALAIMIEALTSGLPGYGRANGPTNWGGGAGKRRACAHARRRCLGLQARGNGKRHQTISKHSGKPGALDGTSGCHSASLFIIIAVNEVREMRANKNRYIRAKDGHFGNRLFEKSSQLCTSANDTWFLALKAAGEIVAARR